MDNKSKKPKGNKKQLPQFNVKNIPDELHRRVTAVAGARGESIGQFIMDVLDNRTKQHKSSVDDIRRREGLSDEPE